MSNTIFTIIACSVIGYVITLVLELFRRLGVNSVVTIALRMVFYDQNAYLNSDVVWNKLWLRFGVLAFVMLACGMVVSALLNPLMPKGYSLTAWFSLTLLLTGVYGYWIQTGKPLFHWSTKKRSRWTLPHWRLTL